MLLDHSEFYQGFFLCLGLIVSIGMQNAFILKQGLLNNNISAVIITCAICDSVLIFSGVNGLGDFLSSNAKIKTIAEFVACGYLIYFGSRSFISAFKNESLKIRLEKDKISISKAILTSIMISFLNPHAIIDTCLLLGSVATTIVQEKRIIFSVGAITASFLWFTTIGYGARFLRKFFEKPISWKILDSLIGVLMYGTAILIYYKS